MLRTCKGGINGCYAHAYVHAYVHDYTSPSPFLPPFLPPTPDAAFIFSLILPLVYYGGSVAYNTKRAKPFLLNDAVLQEKLLSPRIDAQGLEETDGDFYVRSKVEWTAQTAMAFLESANTDFAVAEGGAAGPTVRIYVHMYPSKDAI